MGKKRTAVSKRLRFEVFKRDSFKCQYCGRSAPDVTLQIEHVLPVSKGGDNDILNLLSACVECNAGKSDVLLDDASAMAKQKRQADELNERRLQLESMMKWKRELLRMNDAAIEQIEDYWNAQTGHVFTEHGRETMRKNVRSFGLSEVLECIDIALNQYSDKSQAFNKIGAIANVRKKSQDDPHYQTVCMVRGILRQRLNYINHAQFESMVRQSLNAGANRNEVLSAARECRSWTHFTECLESIGGN